MKAASRQSAFFICFKTTPFNDVLLSAAFCSHRPFISGFKLRKSGIVAARLWMLIHLIFVFRRATSRTALVKALLFTSMCFLFSRWMIPYTRYACLFIYVLNELFLCKTLNKAQALLDQQIRIQKTPGCRTISAYPANALCAIVCYRIWNESTICSMYGYSVLSASCVAVKVIT